VVKEVTQLAFRDDDEKTLILALRHKMITAEVIQRAVYDAQNQKTRLAVEAQMKRLKGPYLEAEPLIWKRRYYHPTALTARLFGAPEEAAEPLGPQALPKEYALLNHCCMRSVPLVRLTRQRLKELFTDWELFLPKKTGFYSDFVQAMIGNRGWISRVQVDRGGDYLRFLSTCRDVLSHCRASVSIRELIEEECFRFTILTGDERKKDSLQAALDVRPLGVPTHIFVVPGLLDLIGQNLAGKEEPHAVQSSGGAV